MLPQTGPQTVGFIMNGSVLKFEDFKPQKNKSTNKKTTGVFK